MHRVWDIRMKDNRIYDAATANLLKLSILYHISPIRLELKVTHGRVLRRHVIYQVHMALLLFSFLLLTSQCIMSQKHKETLVWLRMCSSVAHTRLAVCAWEIT